MHEATTDAPAATTSTSRLGWRSMIAISSLLVVWGIAFAVEQYAKPDAIEKTAGERAIQAGTAQDRPTFHREYPIAESAEVAEPLATF